jgi:hypothetical protein
MAVAIQQFKTVLTPENQNRLDYTAASLDFVEQWLRDRYLDMDFVYQDNLSIFLGATFYVGETYRRHLKGWWKVEMSQLDPNDLHSYKAAQVIPGFDEPDEDGEYEYIVVPMEDLMTTIHERHELFIREVLYLMLKEHNS